MTALFDIFKQTQQNITIFPFQKRSSHITSEMQCLSSIVISSDKTAPNYSNEVTMIIKEVTVALLLMHNFMETDEHFHV
jgi:hypothetical protein